MTGSLPWGWLNSTAPVMPGTEHQHDDVALRPDERLRLGSIVAGWDEEVLCNAQSSCGRPALWVWRCKCGQPWLGCTAHRLAADRANAESDWMCTVCDADVPKPIPWLPL